jgi:hypothetical protein
MSDDEEKVVGQDHLDPQAILEKLEKNKKSGLILTSDEVEVLRAYNNARSHSLRNKLSNLARPTPSDIGAAKRFADGIDRHIEEILKGAGVNDEESRDYAEKIAFARAGCRESAELLLAEFADEGLKGKECHSLVFRFAVEIIDELLDQRNLNKIIGSRPAYRPKKNQTRAARRKDDAIAFEFLKRKFRTFGENRKWDGESFEENIRNVAEKFQIGTTTVSSVVKERAEQNPSFKYPRSGKVRTFSNKKRKKR